MEKKSLPPLIDSERIILKKHKLELASEMYRYVNRDRARLTHFLPWVPFIREVEDEKKYIESTHLRWEAGTLFDYGIFRKEDDVYMGNAGVHTINWEDEKAELGYWILGEFEGKGYIMEAVLALEKVLFEQQFNRIEIRCDASNVRSASVPMRCGYVKEGIFREDSKNHVGKFRDTLIFAKIKRDYIQGNVKR